jgi:monothiol glutaredoxin
MNTSLLFRRVVLTASSATVQRRFAADLAKAKHREIANVRLRWGLGSSKLARSLTEPACAQNIAKKRVVLFMKGTPSAPQCGFSRGVVQILQAEKVDFDAHDVIADNELRNEIKVRFSCDACPPRLRLVVCVALFQQAFSDWPTIPQLYIDGEFVGGYDIVKTMFTDGSLRAALDNKPAQK